MWHTSKLIEHLLIFCSDEDYHMYYPEIQEIREEVLANGEFNQEFAIMTGTIHGPRILLVEWIVGNFLQSSVDPFNPTSESKSDPLCH